MNSTSFSAAVKAELCRQPDGSPCCAAAEIYGALLFGYAFCPSDVRVVTGNVSLPSRLSRLMKSVFGFDFDIKPRPDAVMGKRTLAVTDRAKLSVLFETFGYAPDTSIALHLNNATLENECCPTAFLRGAFLTGGSVADPAREYHLELSTPHRSLSREVFALFNETMFSPGRSDRAGHAVLYLKASEQIEDFLTAIGAQGAALRMMETKVEKDLRNRINRKVNCETANLSKTVAAAVRQTAAVRALRESSVWATLPQTLRDTALVRLRYPEDALRDLCERFDPPLGRSGLNHRLRKLMDLAAAEMSERKE